MATTAPNDALRDFRSNPRRFFRNHGAVHAGFWVREVDITAGEHVHLGIHVPDNLMAHFIGFLAKYTGVALGDPRPGGYPKTHLAKSVDPSWFMRKMYNGPG